mgnify:CR=1 FL=1
MLPRRRVLYLGSLLPIVWSPAGCGSYRLKNLAKSDVNQIADEFIYETYRLVLELMDKLYARNPVELTRGKAETPGDRRRQVTANPALQAVRGQQGQVFVLAVGVLGMLRRAYGYNRELFMFDSLDSAALDTSARNLEILLWRLRNNRRADGRTFLITAEYNGRIDNLSFERLFGKLIALQGMAATIAAGAGNRRVTKAVHTATSVFIPLPL